MKNSTDNIGNRTRDLPTCSTVPQPTAPPRTPIVSCQHVLNKEACTKTENKLFLNTIIIWGMIPQTGLCYQHAETVIQLQPICNLSDFGTPSR